MPRGVVVAGADRQPIRRQSVSRRKSQVVTNDPAPV
jgi:hypothetical protein